MHQAVMLFREEAIAVMGKEKSRPRRKDKKPKASKKDKKGKKKDK